jgi:hypothetical protein
VKAKRKNLWPFGKGQLLGSKTTYRRTRAAKVEPESESYKGYRLFPVVGGYRTSADPESTFEDKRQAKRFVDSFRRNASETQTVAGVDFVTRADGSVAWSSDWIKLATWAAAKQHGFSAKSYGPSTYGHTEVFYSGAARGTRANPSGAAQAGKKRAARGNNPGLSEKRYKEIDSVLTSAANADARKADIFSGLFDPRNTSAERSAWAKLSKRERSEYAKLRREKRGEPYWLAKRNPAVSASEEALATLAKVRVVAQREGGKIHRTEQLPSGGILLGVVPRDGRGMASIEIFPDGRVSKGWMVSPLEHDRLHKGKRNPADAAAEVYEEFHGTPSTEVVTVSGPVHYHSHLAALGKLAYLKVAGVDGYMHTLKDFSGSLLCSNENRNQLFVEGGDQAVDLDVFGISAPHEVETLGQVTEIGYRTDKKHLGEQGGKALYFHITGEDGGSSPDLLYRVRDERLEFSGGSYEITGDGIAN